MPAIADFPWTKDEDGVLIVTMTPPTAIGGWSIQTDLGVHFGGSGRVTKYVSSGRNSQSGISVIDSGLGVFMITIDAKDTSGLDYGNYAYWSARTNSGSVTRLQEGYMCLQP